IGHSNFAMEIEIRQTVEMIEKINSNLEAVEKKIEEFSRQLNSPILAIPGISHISAMSILAEIGDFSKYESAKQIIKLSGTNPFVYESGTYSMARTRLEKKGSKYLRATLYKTIQTVILFNPVFNQYYAKKRAEGKSHLCAQGHCVRKLLRIIYHILTTGKEFDPALLR
ncbi:transposase, partial [Dubosiella muris]